MTPKPPNGGLRRSIKKISTEFLLLTLKQYESKSSIGDGGQKNAQKYLYLTKADKQNKFL